MKEELYEVQPFDSERESLKEKSLEDIIREVAEEEGMTYEETLKLFKQGMKEAHGQKNQKSSKEKARAKAKRKQAKKSRKQNR